MDDSNLLWKIVLGFSGLIGLLVLFLFFMQPVNAAELKDLPKMQTEMFEPAVRIGNYCSGTIIHSARDEKSGDVGTYILTAKHCTEAVDEKTTVQIETYDKRNNLVKTEAYEAFVWGRDYKSDLALLKLRDKDTFFSVIAKVAPEKMEEELMFGQDVWVVSYPLGHSKTLTVGSLGLQEKDPGFGVGGSTTFYRATPDVAGGSSGAAMYTKDKDGNYVLIGTVTGGMRGLSFFNFFTPIEDINNYLETAKKAF